MYSFWNKKDDKDTEAAEGLTYAQGPHAKYEKNSSFLSIFKIQNN